MLRSKGEISEERILDALSRILESSIFAHSRRLSRFLRFTVETTLACEEEMLKEYLIGTEVYERKPSYQPTEDSIVRSEAHRLRSKLKKYYESIGKDDPVFIYYRPGSYIPVFQLRHSQHGKGIVKDAARGELLVEGLGICIAVLPFTDATSGNLSSACAPIITDDLIHELVRTHGLPVTAVGSVFAQPREKKFRDAVETMPALAFVAEPKANRIFMNKGWLEYTGGSPEETSASGWEKTIHPDDLKRIIQQWLASQTTGQPLDCEVRLRRGSDGVYRWFLIRAVPVRDKRGNIVKWCGAATDIEDRKRAEQLQADLTHASRVSTMGELVASISHELVQPITVATANAKASLRWLQRDPPDLTEVRKGTEKIIEASALASEIINRLRSLYKKSSPKRELVAINEVIGEMAGMIGGEARGHGVSIYTDLKDDLPMTVADRVQLQQVLMNLMLNGIEAIKGRGGGVVTVKSQLGEDGRIEISVNDTGPGLPLGKADRASRGATYLQENARAILPFLGCCKISAPSMPVTTAQR